MVVHCRDHNLRQRPKRVLQRFKRNNKPGSAAVGIGYQKSVLDVELFALVRDNIKVVCVHQRDLN
jgi:hypothetical protein